MSKIFKLLSFKNKWPSKLSSRFSWSRLQMKQKKKMFQLIWQGSSGTHKFDKLSKSCNKSLGKKSKWFFERSNDVRCVSARNESLWRVDKWFDERSLWTNFRSINYVGAFKIKSTLHVTNVIGNWLRCRNAFKVQTTTTDLLQHWSAAESVMRNEFHVLTSQIMFTDKTPSQCNDPTPAHLTTFQLSKLAVPPKITFAQSTNTTREIFN